MNNIGNAYTSFHIYRERNRGTWYAIGLQAHVILAIAGLYTIIINIRLLVGVIHCVLQDSNTDLFSCALLGVYIITVNGFKWLVLLVGHIFNWDYRICDKQAQNWLLI